MDIRREALKPFEGIFVKLVYQNGFVLYGVVTEVYSDCLYFTTRQKSSIISFSEISVITPTEEKYIKNNDRNFKKYFKGDVKND